MDRDNFQFLSELTKEERPDKHLSAKLPSLQGSP